MAAHNDEINRQAAEWAAKDDALNGDEQAALDVWLAADIRHVGAYAKATAVLAQVDRMRTAVSVDKIMPSHTMPVLTRRQVVVGGGLAASVVGVAAAAKIGWTYLHRETYSTGIGEIRSVSLSDGSVVTLNTNSKIVVHYTEDRREVALLAGEALFDVAKNKARPFVVPARDVNMRAVGTSFAVRLLPEHPTEVLVREGIVEIKRPSVPVAAPVLVRAGECAKAPSDSPITVARENPDRVAQLLAWKEGRIAFEDVALANAAQEFSRYSDTRIVIDDPAVAKRTVTGLFVANDPVGFAKAVATSLGLRAEVREHQVTLMRKQ